MRVKTLVSAIALAALPAVAMAECSWSHKNQSVSQCPTGQTYDSDKSACVPLAAS